MPFFPLWLGAKGLEAGAIGVVLAAPMLLRLFAIPIGTRLADRAGTLKGALVAAACASAVAFVLVGLADGFAAILAAFAIATLLGAPVLPLGDAYGLKGLAARGLSYGPVRLWGSVAFIAANLGGGLLLGVDSAGVPDLADRRWPAAPWHWQRWRWRRSQPIRCRRSPPVSRHLRSPAFLLVAAAAGLMQASHAAYYGFSALDWSARGFGGPTIGALWALGVVAEIVLFAFSARLPRALAGRADPDRRRRRDPALGRDGVRSAGLRAGRAAAAACALVRRDPSRHHAVPQPCRAREEPGRGARRRRGVGRCRDRRRDFAVGGALCGVRQSCLCGDGGVGGGGADLRRASIAFSIAGSPMMPQRRGSIVPGALALLLAASPAAAFDLPYTLSKPAGDGPFPAVVILHDCSGLGPRSSGAPARWARHLTAQGYVTIWPDSFSTRGHPDGVCVADGGPRVTFEQRAEDAYAALKHLSLLRVAVMGGSHGGSTTLAAIVDSPANARREPSFAAAVALYPACGRSIGAWRVERARETITGTSGVFKPLAPLLILIGERDDWTPAEPCRRLAAAAQQAGHPVEIVVYPGVHHSFDAQAPERYVAEQLNINSPTGRGATTGGNREAWADAIRRVEVFFGKLLIEKDN